MDNSEFHNVVTKFLFQESDHTELEQLDILLKDTKNSAVFNQFVRTEYLTTLCMGEYNLNKAKELINDKVKKSEKKRKAIFFRKIAIAASVLLIAGLSVFQLTDKKNSTVVENNSIIEIGTNKAILTLENGNQVALGEGENYKTDVAISNGEELVYASHNKNTSSNEDVLFNYLTIPKGGQFFVQLADGTKIWLNSDSKLKYPTKFVEGKTRKVELVYGEAYLQVSPSTEHKGAIFNILTKTQEVNVIGTEFNIKAYNDDDVISTTLVEGKILVQNGDTKKILKPNQQSKISKDSSFIAVKEIDATHEISWVNGMFAFNEESLGEMMKVLSRWYNVEVIFESAERKDFVFTGVLERTKSFVDILELIEAPSDEEVKLEIK
jgi:hypothetical protein